MRTKFSIKSVPRQTIGNIGLYYASYWLSIFGWNVLPTSRNAKGVDLFIYSQDGLKKLSIQIKTLSKPNTVSLGGNLDNIISDYFIICARNYPDSPDCYILKTAEIKGIAYRCGKDRDSFWLQRKDYEKKSLKINGKGLVMVSL